MHEIKLPWAAWHGDSTKKLSFPESWQIHQFELKSDQVINSGQIKKQLEGLSKNLADKKPANAVIVVDDLSRPVKLEAVLKEMFTQFAGHGIGLSDITILIGLGSHKGLTTEALKKKLGAFAVENVRCVNHDPEDVVSIGAEWGKTDIKLNRLYVEADFKLVISGLTPHSFAGFSGGAKMLFPGLADMETIAKTHKSVLMGFMGKLGDLSHNKFRDMIEIFVEMVGIDYFVGVVINGDRSIHSLYGGDYVTAHRLAADAARKIYLCDVETNPEPFDLLVLNAYPKDTELLQAENAFIPLKSAVGPLLKEGGIVLVTSACSEGMGHHGLFEPDGKLYRKPRALRFLKNMQFCFYSENISAEDFYKIYDSSYLFFNDKKMVHEYLANNLADDAKVGIFPNASLQLTG